MLGGAGEPGGGELLTVTVVRDEHGYGMKVSGDNPVYVQSVKEHGAAWRAGLRAGDRILCVDSVHVYQHTHQQVVHMIRAKPTTVLTVQQNNSRNKTPITAPLPVNPENQRQLEESKVLTMKLMLQKEQKYIRELRNEVQKVPDVRKQAQLEAAMQRCSKLQHEIDTVMAAQGESTTGTPSPGTPRAGFLSGLPRSLSNLTGQSLRNLRQARARNDAPLAPLSPLTPLTPLTPTHTHTNTVPLVPTTCLDNAPPPLPPRSTERPKRSPMNSISPPPLSQGQRPPYKELLHPPHGHEGRLRRSSRSLDGELEGPQPNSIALQMSYPLVNAPPPPLQTDNRSGLPILHTRSQSSPEHLDHAPPTPRCGEGQHAGSAERAREPPGTPPPPYAHNTQPCADPQRAIISMEEDDSPASVNSSCSGLFSNLRSVRDSRARMAVLLNWLIGERRCPCAWLVLVLTEQFRTAAVPAATLRRWAYEIQSSFLMPHAALQLNGVDEHMANEIDHVLLYEYHKEELLRNVFRKARQRAKEELSAQLGEFQLKRQVGLGTLYGPDDAVLDKCDVDKAQEQVVVERLMYDVIKTVSSGPALGCCGAQSAPANRALHAALAAAALCLDCRPAAVAAAASTAGARDAFLQRDKLYKQRLKHIAKQRPQPYVVRGHQLQLQALTSVAHCHHCDLVIWGLAPQAYVCANCNLRVHRECAKSVEEGCVLDGEHHNNRISRFMERIHHNNQPGQDASDKKSRKASGTGHFLNMERSFRKMEDEPTWEQTLTPTPVIERRDESDESLYESADCHSDAISASDDALPRLGKTPTMSKESLKLAVTDEEVDNARLKRGHRKTMSLSNPLEMVKNLGDEWFDHTKKDPDKNYDKRKSRESLWSEEDRDSIHGSTMKLNQIRKNSKKDEKNNLENRKSSATEISKPRKGSKGTSVGALSFLRRIKTPTAAKSVEAVMEVADGLVTTQEILNYTKFFLEEEKLHSSLCESKPPPETDSDDEPPPPKLVGEHRRRLSRQTSRSKSKVRGKSQSVKVNTLRKTHSGTLKKGKKKSVKTPSAGRSRQASIVDTTPVPKKRNSDTFKQHSWLFSASTHKGESKREGSTEEPSAPEADADPADTAAKEQSDKEHNWRAGGGGGGGGGGGPGGRAVNRAESCRERDAPRRGKHRNASDPNRLTAHHNHDLEPGAATAPSGSSSSSSLSSRSNESNTVAAEQQASQSDWSEEEEPLAAQWADSLPPRALDTLLLPPRLRKRQEVIHELIVSEGSHVRWLKVLDGVFHRPLVGQPALLPGDELRALFPNLPGVRERHARLYAELRAARSGAPDHIVHTRPVIDALLNTLGEPGYASCLSRFCRGQRMALEALRERRRKHKELHQFLCSREQLPLCGRLQLRDLLACVWQRLTKYQLLLEGLLKTVSEAEGDSAEDARAVRRALLVAKDVLNCVDTAIRSAENEHRLRMIQSKLEVRAGAGAEWDELRRLELPAHSLRLEGELALRNDSKRVSVLALLLDDCLVLLQREGDKFILKPINQPSQQGQLSPLIKWDKVLFRPNAAVRNTFFLMNINGVQMHELSANTPAEYTTWVKHIQQAPLAKLTELKPALAPHHHHHSRSIDDSGINVSRNPSDASEKSSSTAPDEERDREHAPEQTPEPTPEQAHEQAHEHGGERDGRSVERLEQEREEKREEVTRESDPDDSHKQRRATVGRISTHSAESAPALAPRDALTVRDPPPHVHTARRALTHHERLRRLDEVISRALRAKSGVVGELLGVPADSYAHLAEFAVADTLGQVDMSEMEPTESDSEVDIHQLLLAAHEQANQLTEMLARALTVDESSAIAARSGRCDSCRRPHARARENDTSAERSDEISELESCLRASGELLDGEADDATYDTLADPARPASTAPATPVAAVATTGAGACAEPPFEGARAAGAARLAQQLCVPARALSSALGRLLAHAPPQLARAQEARSALAAHRDLADALRARTLHADDADFTMTEEISFPKAVDMDRSMQDQPSNGG